MSVQAAIIRDHKATVGFVSAAVILTVGMALSSAKGSERQRAEDRLVEEQFFEDRERGWHWYEVIRIEEIPEEIEPPQTKPSSSTESESETAPAPLSAEWLRETLPALRDAAIDTPTQSNVRAYFYAQRIMMDKAQIFSDVAQSVVRSDPLLDENLRLPFASAARAATLSSAEDAKKSIIESLADKAGLWVFYDETCEFCERQITPLNRFAERHSIEMRVISRQGRALPSLSPRVQVLPDIGQFESLGINFTPAVVMVVPPEGFYIISQGYIDYTSLLDRLVAAANQYGLISVDKYYAARPAARGILETSGLEDHQPVNWNDSESWVPFIQREIARVYGIDQSSR